MSQKPKFVFFKMLGCGHCVSFFQSPTPETSTWAQLLKDPAVSKAVDSEMIEWGGIYKDGKLQSVIPVPTGYEKIGPEGKGVTYGPFFYLHQAGKPLNGIEMNGGKVPRDFENMKKWILSNADTFKSKSEAPPPRSAAVAPVRKQQPRPRPLAEVGPSTPGKPAVFNQEKLQGLPVDVRSRLHKDVQESEPKFVSLQQRKTNTPNLQPYVQSLSSSQCAGYQASSDAAKFKSNQPSVATSHLTMSKAPEPAGVERKYIPRNRRK